MSEIYRAALERIAAIEDRMVGGDWEEIEEARQIARAALAQQAATPTDAREAFEAWLGREAFTERSDSGKYVSAHVDAMWSAWRAALAQQAVTPTLASPGLPDIDMPVAEAITYWRTAARQNWEASNKLLAQLDEARQAATPAPAEPVAFVDPERLDVLRSDGRVSGVSLRTKHYAFRDDVPLYAAPPATPAAQPPEPAEEVVQRLMKTVHAYACSPTPRIRAALESALRAALAQAVPAGDGWIAVADRLPEPDAGEVLVWLTGGRCAFDEWHMHREDPIGLGGPTMEMGYMWRDYDFEEITHWRPLPSAPALEGQG